MGRPRRIDPYVRQAPVRPGESQFPDEFIVESQEFWGRKLGLPLTEEETVEILHNIVGYFRLLKDVNDQVVRTVETAKRKRGAPATETTE